MKTLLISNGPWYSKGDYTKSFAYKIELRDETNRVCDVWFRDSLDNLEIDAKQYFKKNGYISTDLLLNA